MKINYLDIILRGYLDQENRQVLGEYFISEQKIAEREHYCKPLVFFNGLMNTIKRLDKNLDNQLFELKIQFDLRSADIDGKNFAESLIKDNVNINLFGLTNGPQYTGELCSGHLSNSDLNEIKEAWLMAYENCLDIPDTVTINNDKSINDKKFTAFGWALIFYYDYRYSEKIEHIFKKKAIELFILKHNATTTLASITNDEIKISKSINNNAIDTKKFISIQDYIKANFHDSVFDAMMYDIDIIKDEQSRK